ncbi:MAG: glycosyl hydrolase 53 family protein [Bacilli bacterium]|nr:glycosyl hydrolase 53 family protein [Bacilli bacterium]
MRRKIFLGMSVLSMALFVGAAFVVASNDGTPSFTPIQADNSYTLAATRGVDVTDGVGAIKTALGADVQFSFSKYTKQDAYFGDLGNGGYIRNDDIIHTIRSIDVSITGEVKIYHGHYDGYKVVYNESDVATFSTGSHTLDLSASLPTYFKIEASGDGTTSISSFSVTYSCAVQSIAKKYTIRVNKPTVGGSDQIKYGNKLWINTDAVSDSWQNYEMIADGDTYYYTFENVKLGEYRSAENRYGFNLVLSGSSASGPDWNYEYDYGTYFFSVFEGQDELFVDEDFNFTSQPIPASSPYTLKLNVEMRGGNEATNFGELKFVYRQSESGEFNWDTKIGTSKADNYTINVAGLDKTKTLQFKLYLWHNSTDGESFITPSGSDVFVYDPSVSDSHVLTVAFDYPTTGNAVGYLMEGEDDDPATTMSYANQTVNIHHDSVRINPVFNGNSQPFSWEYSGNNIRIDDDGTIIGLKADTTTTVNLTSVKGLTCSFNVTVPASTYEATWTRDLSYNGGSQSTSVAEGWFNQTDVSAVDGFDDDFFNGADVSSVKALYDNGSKFFNTDGVEQSLFWILKESGFNWVRTKIWVDPETNSGKTYGGGESTLENALWVAKEAKAAGLKVLLDFHYSDYWTHPGQQILPKAWASVSTSDQLAGYIADYTKDTLGTFNAAGCLPEMVQLGNEISSGSFLQTPGADSDTFGTVKEYYEGNVLIKDKSDLGKPNYLMGMHKASAAISGTRETAEGIANQNKYLNAAAEAVNDNYPSVKKVIHWAKGGDRIASASRINSFFTSITADYDYAGISLYPYYCFDSMDEASSILASLNPGKPWFVAETSYPFSGYSFVYENDTDVAEAAVNSWTIEADASKELAKKSLTLIHNDYPFNASGQARMIHDLTDTVIKKGGKGIFYWEPAWVPNQNVGWAGEGSAVSWANQGFFSYDGKAIPNIGVFNRMKGK